MVHMSEEILKKYSYLWDGKDRSWVLLRSPSLPGGLCIYNKEKNSLLHVESNELNQALCERLKQKGCEVLDTVPAGKIVAKPQK